MRDFLSKKYARYFIVVVLAATFIASLALAALVRRIPVTKTDLLISEELQENHSPAFHVLMRAVSFVGDPLPAAGTVILGAIVLIAAQYQREALFMLLVPVADLVGTIIKNIVERPRPSDLFVAVYEQATDPSFPSGHVIHVVVFFGYLFMLAVLFKKWHAVLRAIMAVTSIIMILLISVSRIYLGAHWASDVVGGYLIGFLMLSGLLGLYFRATRPQAR